jgi:hypothetical protein
MSGDFVVIYRVDNGEPLGAPGTDRATPSSTRAAMPAILRVPS